MTGFIYLASQSPRRVELLRQVGIAFQPLLPDPDEDVEALEATRPGEDPAAYVKRVVLAKLQAARERLSRRDLPPAPVLCADTTVAIGGTLLGKPADAAQATGMLERLAGRSHRVLTAVAVGDARHAELAIQVSRVSFARLSAAQIAAYVAGGEPFGKAGGYAIQGTAAAFVRRIEGSHSGIMGLPLHETCRLVDRALRRAARHAGEPSRPPACP
ncbi:MAG: septum formation inhibitor Maf [Betaproteobacteria bacterium]|nr:septum formation inhibitor Maf [Betaproteobacteria bacterium]